MPHWTYQNIDERDLQQGDLIRRTPELLDVLKDAHRHFLDQKYTAFIVLTQSCDLVQRDGNPCKSRYINLAVVRPIEDLLISLLDSECTRVNLEDRILSGIYKKETKNKAEQLLSRIIHQNEQGIGLFYLHPDADAGIAEASVALLQVSIALRREHYQTLLNARMGRLTPEFQSRLGWLIGNLYSRVATRDWDPEESKEIIKDLLESQTSTSKLSWIPAKSIRTFQSKSHDISGKTDDEIVTLLLKLPATKPKQIAIDRTVELLNEMFPETSLSDLEKLKTRLINDQTYESAFRQQS